MFLISFHLHCSITNESENFTKGNFHVRSSSRRNFIGSLVDVHHTMLLVPINETSLESLLTLENKLMPPVSTDEIKQSICSSLNNGTSPRTVIKLRYPGMLPESGDAITNCPSNVDQICLNLKDDDATSEYLKHSQATTFD